MNFDTLATEVLNGYAVTRAEAQAILNSSNEDLSGLLNAAERIRQDVHGRDVTLHVLQNAKSGSAPGPRSPPLTGSAPAVV